MSEPSQRPTAPLRVLFTPYSPANPYQALLAAALRAQGVEVVNDRREWRIDLPAAQTRGVDVIHLHWLAPLFLGGRRWVALARSLRLLWRLTRLRLAGVKLVWTVHNLLGHERRHAWLDRFMSRRLARMAHGIITHCQRATELAQQAYGLPDAAKFVVVPHANYIGVYPDTIDRAAARAALQLPDAAPVFVFLGQIRPYKGVLDMIEAFAALGGEARLVIAGKCESVAELAELRTRVADRPNVHLHARFVPDEEVQVFMNAADVVVLPYRDVLTSGGLLLAMSFGRAAVAPRLGCIPETVDDAGGFLYDPADPAGLRDALQSALAAHDRLPAMGEHNRRRIQPLDWRHMATLTAAVYRRAVGHKH